MRTRRTAKSARFADDASSCPSPGPFLRVTQAAITMFLSYLALFILIVVIIVVVYVFIWIHDIPYMLAKKRNHPNLHAIHIACWLSLFTLHALWPFVFLWAIAKKPQVEVIVVGDTTGGAGLAAQSSSGADDPAALRLAVAQLIARLDALEKRGSAGGHKHG